MSFLRLTWHLDGGVGFPKVVQYSFGKTPVTMIGISEEIEI